jgi:hypothetical protein
MAVLGCAGAGQVARVEAVRPESFAGSEGASHDPAVLGGKAATDRLDVEVVVLDRDGKPVASREPGADVYALGGRYRVRVRSACQPDAEYALDFGGSPQVALVPSAERDVTRVAEGGLVTVRLPIGRPAPERLFVKAPTSASALTARTFDRGVPHLKLPPSSQVELVRRWPDPDSKCSLAAVRVVDAGSAIPPATLLMVPLDALSAQPPEPTPPQAADAATPPAHLLTTQPL